MHTRRPPWVSATSAMTCCHGSGGTPWVAGSHELRVVGCHGGERLGHRDPIDQQALPFHDVPDSVGVRERDARRLDGGRVRGAAAGSQPLTAAPARQASQVAADAPAPAAPMTWIRSPGRMGRAARASARPAPMSAADRVTRSAGRAAAAARRGRSPACWPTGRRPTGVARPCSRHRPRPRRRSVRRASCRCRRWGPRCP